MLSSLGITSNISPVAGLALRRSRKLSVRRTGFSETLKMCGNERGPGSLHPGPPSAPESDGRACLLVESLLELELDLAHGALVDPPVEVVVDLVAVDVDLFYEEEGAEEKGAEEDLIIEVVFDDEEVVLVDIEDLSVTVIAAHDHVVAVPALAEVAIVVGSHRGAREDGERRHRHGQCPKNQLDSPHKALHLLVEGEDQLCYYCLLLPPMLFALVGPFVGST